MEAKKKMNSFEEPKEHNGPIEKYQNLRTEQKSNVKNSVWRLVFVGLLLLAQIFWTIVVLNFLNNYSTLITILTTITEVIVVLAIYGRHINSAFKLPWIMLILGFPIVGLFLYLTMGTPNNTKGMRLRYSKIDAKLFPSLSQDKRTFEELEKMDLSIANQARYIRDYAMYPIYDNNKITYYSEASDAIEAQKAELLKAEKFIFMEYHAIEDGSSFAGIKEILAKKAAEGVEVRLFYDDVGSVGFIDPGFIRRMEAVGVKCRVFNPVSALFNIFMNNRDHRKITVIDGKVGFVGGYNLANEYFNITHPYGYWKDTGIRMEGSCVKSLTVMFLEMWNAVRKSDIDDTSFDKFIFDYKYEGIANGFIQPYADSPLDNEHVGEDVYMNILKNAKKYCYFITPYLITTDEMTREICNASKRGVDVRIITPGIPDKKLIYQVTRSYYNRFVRNGVKIYEYAPGFCHAKMCISDDETATVGTINLDFRSLYLHFENGCFLYKVDCIKDIREDFADTFAVSEDVSKKYMHQSRIVRSWQCCLRLFSPLM